LVTVSTITNHFFAALSTTPNKTKQYT